MVSTQDTEQSQRSFTAGHPAPKKKAAGIRERNRIELTAEILASARRHLVTHGAADLSIRAITRDLGMASSAIYRYFASRDELLTALIIEAYNDLADRIEQADKTVAERHNHRARWAAISHSIRAWALDNPQQWALIYGTPIIGYAAPEDTVAAATRSTRPLLQLLIDESARSNLQKTGLSNEAPILAQGLSDILDSIGEPMPQVDVVNGLGAWAEIIGLISLELFGHLENVVVDRDAHFSYLSNEIGNRLNFETSLS